MNTLRKAALGLVAVGIIAGSIATFGGSSAEAARVFVQSRVTVFEGVDGLSAGEKDTAIVELFPHPDNLAKARPIKYWLFARADNGQGTVHVYAIDGGNWFEISEDSIAVNYGQFTDGVGGAVIAWNVCDSAAFVMTAIDTTEGGEAYVDPIEER